MSASVRAEQQAASNKQQQQQQQHDRTHGGEVGRRVVSKKKKGSGRVVAQNGSTAGGREERKGGDRGSSHPPTLPPHPARLGETRTAGLACSVVLSAAQGFTEEGGAVCCTRFSVGACLSLYVCPAPTPSYHSAT